MKWNPTSYLAYRNFPQAPPHYDGAPPRPTRNKPPYKGAPGWQCSVYFYWWEYLRRHEGYRTTCLAGGDGEYAELYGDFGDVHATNFHAWWEEHFMLFTSSGDVRVITHNGPVRRLNDGYVLVQLPIGRSVHEMARTFVADVGEATHFKRLLNSAIKYKVSMRPVLSSLHDHLRVWDARHHNPDLSDAEIADIAQIAINHVVNGETIAQRKLLNRPFDDLEKAITRQKQLIVQRHLRIAEQYIDNVSRGFFPLRSTR